MFELDGTGLFESRRFFSNGEYLSRSLVFELSVMSFLLGVKDLFRSLVFTLSGDLSLREGREIE